MPPAMAGGYENEDAQARLEEMRREKEREAWERLEAERKAAAKKAAAPDAPDARPASGEPRESAQKG